MSDGEKAIVMKLRQRFPSAQHVHVQDVSGGCGSMYAVQVVSNEFDNLSRVKQQQLVTKVCVHACVCMFVCSAQALKDDITAMHGIRVFTATPTEYSAQKQNS
jgi:stress-induced morphogen